jgi:hypothetical protein
MLESYIWTEQFCIFCYFHVHVPLIVTVGGHAQYYIIEISPPAKPHGIHEPQLANTAIIGLTIDIQGWHVIRTSFPLPFLAHNRHKYLTPTPKIILPPT